LDKRLLFKLAAPLVFCLLLTSLNVFAGVTGKISGVVENTNTGEPIIGATLKVLGTNLATTTDEDGEYFIIGIPIGKYDVVVSHVGYEMVQKEGVRVLLDLTTPVDFTLQQVAVELKREVVVVASNPIIQKDLTESKVIFTSDRLQNMPNVISVQSILTNYPGVLVGRDDNLHVRGGRAGQISYYYDGFSIQDPFVANAGMRIMPTALEELTLTSGGFTAEYGEALSGVVSAITREGGADYRGKIRMYEAYGHPYNVNNATWGKLTQLDNRSVSFNLSGPLPGIQSKRYTFFTAGEYLRNNSFLPHNWDISYTGTAKLSMQPTPNLKLKSNFTYYKADGATYIHRDNNDRSYDFNLDGLPLFERDAYLFGITGNYSIKDRIIAHVSFNRFSTNIKSAPEHLMDLHWSEWPGYTEGEDGVYNGTIHEDNYGNTPHYDDEYWMTGFISGDDYIPRYHYRESKYNSFNASVIDQVDKHNQLKAGFEYRKYDIFWDDKQFYNTNPYGEVYSSKPTYASVYVQDKLEYEDYIVNFGLRFDYRDADISYNITPGEEEALYKEADSKSNFSPRFGISFPVSEKTVMHFNYGIYYQVPRYSYLYTNLQGDLSSGLPLLGNPDLEPERTVSYELGLDHLIGEDLRLDVTAFNKDIEDLVTTRYYSNVGGGTSMATQFVNEDYGSVQGFDIALDKLPGSGYFSASISYSYMIATGNGSDAYDAYMTYLNPAATDTLPPVTEYYLDFDQRHTVTAVLDYRVPREWAGNFFGLKVPGAWGFNIVGNYGSGLPYTKTDVSGVRLGERNEGRLPANYSVDFRFNKNFYFGKQSSNFLTFFVEVDNLFNRLNVLDVYAITGEPDDDNNAVSAGLTLDQTKLDQLDYLYDHDPLNYSAPRTVRTGLEINF